MDDDRQSSLLFPSTRFNSFNRWQTVPLDHALPAQFDTHNEQLHPHTLDRQQKTPIAQSAPVYSRPPPPPRPRPRRLRTHQPPSPLPPSALITPNSRHNSSSSIRSLTAILSPSSLDHISTMATAAPETSPGSPPGLSSSRSSTKSDSLPSSGSHHDDADDMSNFEDISLGDAHREAPQRSSAPVQPKTRPVARPNQMMRGPRAVKSASNLREASNGLRASVTLNNHVRAVGHLSPTLPNGLSPSTSYLGSPSHRQPRRSTSPSKRMPNAPSTGSPIHPRLVRSHTDLPVPPHRPRKSPAQQKPRKTAEQLEAEYDDNDDELPEDVFFTNVPISPRPPGDCSGTTSPQNPLSAQLSPAVGSDMGRPRSWDEAMRDLSLEARELTLKLETHATMIQRRMSASDVVPGAKSTSPPRPWKNTVVPPVQRGSYMIDPLPASKEKEKHLARTRPSWLPPKDPKEEKKHLKEYQRMMNTFYEAEKRKSADAEKIGSASKRNSKDAEAALRTWRAILGDWDSEVHKKNTRELWWQGVPPALRGQVWSRAIGNDLHLNATSFKAALGRAKAAEERISGTDRLHASAQARGHARNVSAAESRQDQRARRSLNALEEDIETGAFPSLGLFQKGQSRHRLLRDLLLAYAAYREDTGHVRGTAGVGALLLLQFMPAHAGPPTTPRGSRVLDSAPPSPSVRRNSQTDKPLPTVPETAKAATPDDRPSAAEEAATASAFVLFANLLNRPLSLALCLNDPAARSRTFSHVRKTLKAKLPRLEQHLGSLAKDSADPDAHEFQLTWSDVATPMCKSLFTSHLEHNDAARAWDVLVFEGDGVVVRGVVACLARLEPELYGTAAEIARVLSPRARGDEDAKRRLSELGDEWVEWLRWAGREEGDMPTRRR